MFRIKEQEIPHKEQKVNEIHEKKPESWEDAFDGEIQDDVHFMDIKTDVDGINEFDAEMEPGELINAIYNDKVLFEELEEDNTIKVEDAWELRNGRSRWNGLSKGNGNIMKSPL